MEVLELFSGIGGMHMALNESKVIGNVKASIDINTVANEIYKHNFPENNLISMNIEGLTVKFIKKLEVNTILMSPPCQPFTRNGKQNDVKDARTNPFIRILNLLPELDNIKRILIENVKGFDKSEMRTILLETLKNNNFTFQEFILSPNQIGVPNTRHRYYCLAKRKPDMFNFQTEDMMTSFPFEITNDCFEMSEIKEDNINLEDYLLSEKILRKRLKVLDICYKNSNRSCCFTKAYGRYLEGTGSVYTDKSVEEYQEILKQLENVDNNTDQYLNLAQSLNLRFFTPKEICQLMCFPEKFSFPNSTTNRQKYMVLGNSINVKVVSELIKLLK